MLGACVINILILPHTDPIGSWRRLVFLSFICMSSPRPAPVQRSPLSPAPHAPRRRKKEEKKKRTKERQRTECTLKGAQSPVLTFLSHWVLLPPPRAAKETISLTPVSRRGASTARVAFSSSKSTLSQGPPGISTRRLADALPQRFGLRSPASSVRYCH